MTEGRPIPASVYAVLAGECRSFSGMKDFARRRPFEIGPLASPVLSRRNDQPANIRQVLEKAGAPYGKRPENSELEFYWAF